MLKRVSDYDGMLMYHGSTFVVDCIDLNVSKIASDFGCAFYLTQSKKQAESWVVGPIADDAAQEIIENYQSGLYNAWEGKTKQKVIELLKPYRLQKQVALCTQMAVNRVVYDSSYIITGGA